ncbi:MAG: tol-pal system protein YbgF [Alphaproteobacteria bacterium]
MTSLLSTFGPLLGLAGRHLAAFAGGLIVAAGLLFSLPAAGQTVQPNDIQALLARIQSLERSLSTLEQQVFRQAAQGQAAQAASAAPADTAALLVRLQTLESELRTTTGLVEELSFEIRQVRERLDKLVADMDFRLRALEDGATGGAVAAAADPAPTTAAARPTAGTPQEQYDEARRLLLAQDFAAAEIAMRQFVETHPTDDLAAAAQYWLGETYYVRSDFENAALAFVDGYQTYPASTKGPDYLLKLGMSLARLGRNEQACATFDELDAAFRTIASNIRQRMAAERDNLSCP